METSKKIKKQKKGYSYEILSDEVPFIVQDFKPGVEGFIPMTEEEASNYSNKELEFFEKVEELEKLKEV